MMQLTQDIVVRVDKETSDELYIEHVLRTAEEVGGRVFADIEHQTNKYGAQRVDGFGWIAILVEEFGETTQAYLKNQPEEAIAEARQTIACLSRFITEVEREQQDLNAVEAEWYERAR